MVYDWKVAAVVREVVPSMAMWVEDRMDQLHISPGRLEELTGRTGPGLMPIRKGHRKRYMRSLKWDVCAALQFTDDSIDLMLAGQAPVAMPGSPEVRISLAEASARVARLAAKTEDLEGQLDASDVRRAAPARRPRRPAR